MQHYGGAPLPPYEPVFNWRAARVSVFGQRLTELPTPRSESWPLEVQYFYEHVHLEHHKCIGLLWTGLIVVKE